MAYTPVTWKNREDPTFDSGTDPAITAANLNRIEAGISDAHDHMDDDDIHIDFDNCTETLSFDDNDWILIQSATDGTIRKIRAGNLLR